MQTIDAKMNDVWYYADILKNSVSSSLDLSVNFEDAVQDKIDSLNYFAFDAYNANYEIFKTYSGIPDAYTPYYNYKNVTHPSYQIHPFLWKFVEASKIKEILSRSFDSLQNDRLESKNIAGYIDGIVGKFGEVINIWENNTIDFSGYTTRYEISKHIDENVSYSEVVDYDGSFYPPAVEDYVKNKDVAAKSVLSGLRKTDVSRFITESLSGYPVLSSREQLTSIQGILDGVYVGLDADEIISGFDSEYPLSDIQPKSAFVRFVQQRLPETFFERYYSHLPIEETDDSERAFIASQLSNETVFERIRDITETKSDISGVYDIYRYGKDSYGNMYSLLKRYSVENPSYKEKRDTLG